MIILHYAIKVKYILFHMEHEILRASGHQRKKYLPVHCYPDGFGWVCVLTLQVMSESTVNKLSKKKG